MKKILLSSIFFVSCISIEAQTAATSISENFDVSCAHSSGFPAGWNLYTPVAGTIPYGAWTCTAEGRDGTPGMMCTDTFGTPVAYHLDTSYLITPLLDIDSYAPVPVYLRFDSKTTNVNLGGKLNIYQADYPDSTFHLPLVTDTDITGFMFPVIGEGDSSGWVTHQVELTEFEGKGPFYVAFRYVSPATSGNTWYLDNINTSTGNLVRVTELSRALLSLKVIGYPTTSQITLSYTTAAAGECTLEIYDMMGRIAYNDVLNAQEGTFSYNVDNLNLKPGLYLIKMGNGNCYNTAKTVVR